MDYEILVKEEVVRKLLVKGCDGEDEAKEAALSGCYTADLGIVEGIFDEFLSIKSIDPIIDGDRREELIVGYAETCCDNMESYFEFVKEKIEYRLASLSDKALLAEIEKFCPELLRSI